jgi:hypothetical protein
MRSYISRDGLLFVTSVLFLALGFLWAFGCAPGPRCELTVTYGGVGSGTVSPDGGSFRCGRTITLTAIPDGESTFGSWGCDLSGHANPTTLLMDGDKFVMATFMP